MYLIEHIIDGGEGGLFLGGSHLLPSPILLLHFLLMKGRAEGKIGDQSRLKCPLIPGFVCVLSPSEVSVRVQVNHLGKEQQDNFTSILALSSFSFLY